MARGFSVSPSTSRWEMNTIFVTEPSWNKGMLPEDVIGESFLCRVATSQGVKVIDVIRIHKLS